MVAGKRGARTGGGARNSADTARDTRVIVVIALVAVAIGLGVAISRGSAVRPDFFFGRQAAPPAQQAPAQ